MARSRIGLFGGTFDPPHLGHLILASEAAHQLNLDRILWVLGTTPPHKAAQGLSPIEDRLQMLELALGDNPAFEISRLELDRPGPHFTLETLQFLRAHEPAAEITLLLGGDSLHDLPGWRQPGEILAACNAIGVMRRAGESGDLLELERKLPGIRAKVRFLDAPLIGIASRDIRDRVSKGLPFRYLLPPAVYDYVLRRRLYHS